MNWLTKIKIFGDKIKRNLKKRQNPVTNVFKLVNKLKNKIL